jgi:hypothetical protein
MRHTVSGETLKVIGFEPVAVCESRRRKASLGESIEEAIQLGDKIAAVLVIGRPEPGELKHQHAHLFPNRFAGLKKGFGKPVGVEEVRVGLPGPYAKSFQIRKLFERDGVSYFEPKEEILGNLGREAFQILRGWESIIGGIH